MGLSIVTSRLANTGLVALVALDVVLVGVALKSNNTNAIDTSPVSSAAAPIDSTGAIKSPAPTPSVTSPTPSITSPTTASGTATTAPAAPLRTMLVAIDNAQAWRVSVGTCSAGGATLATTTDGGTSWAEAKAPMRTIVRMRPTDGRSAFVIGADSGCEAELKSTTNGGGTWGSTSDVGSAWFRDPKNPRVVGAPGPSTSQPCGGRAVLDLVVLSPDSARVLCADGLVRSTTNVGSSWISSGTATGAVAMAVRVANPAQTYVARLGATGCAGVEVRQVGQSVPTSCIATAVPQEPGQIALSLVGGGGWLTVGEATLRSTDDLVTWSVS